jgi:hypothetical protein
MAHGRIPLPTVTQCKIPLHTLTQDKLDTLTRAFPGAKRVLAYPPSAELLHMFTLEFDSGQKRLLDAAARKCGVSSERLIYNAVFVLAEDVVGERRAKRLLARQKRSQRPRLCGPAETDSRPLRAQREHGRLDSVAETSSSS